MTTVGSLCSGYGGLEMGLAMVADIDVAWHAEVDPHASLVLAHHHPDVPNIGDIAAVDWAAVEPVDIVTAGYPCQPFSQAGARQGAADVRHLWPAVAEAVRVLRPRHVVLENVAGHLSLGFGTVLGDLAALGYDAQWACVRASDIGAPHRRDRVFVVAQPADADSMARTPTESVDRFVGEVGGQGPEPGVVRLHRAPPERGPATPDTGRTGTGGDPRAVPRAVEEHRRPGVDLHAAEHVGADVATHPDRERQPGWSEPDQRAHQPRVEAPRRPDPDRLGATAWGPYAPAIARWEHLTRPAPAPVDDRRRLAPDFVEWLMGLPDGWVTAVPGITRTAQLRILGNGVVPAQAAAALGALLAQEVPA